MKRTPDVILLTVGVLLLPAAAAAQTFAASGSRAAGMGGAFVAVADDASALYWNPAGMAAGAFFSLVMDSGTAEAAPDDRFAAGERSSFLLALSTPALGIGYYRLRATAAATPFALLPDAGAGSGSGVSIVGDLQVDSLVTHHAGVTLVQSLAQGVAIGTTLKLVRGIASSQLVAGTRPADALDEEAAELLGRATNTFDLDVGLMAYGGPLKVGLTVRNLREPKFRAAGDEDRDLLLERQARAGVSYAIAPDWTAAADFDLLRTNDAFGERRDAALGVEGRLVTRLWVRSGVRFNTVEGDRSDGERGRAFSVGTSYAARAGTFIDAHFSQGSDRLGTEWGVAARFVY